MGRLRSDVLDHLVPVPFAAQAFDSDLALHEPTIRADVATLVTELADRARGTTALAAA
jgi:hypothetical protein